MAVSPKSKACRDGTSVTTHKFHLEQDYTKRLFTALESMLAGAPIMTKLNAL